MTLAIRSLAKREWVRFYRQKSRIVGALGTPVLFWLLLGSGIGMSFQSEAMPVVNGYLEYFFPGTLILIVLFSAIFSTISVIEDHQAGFLQSVLASPVSRTSLVLGKILGGAVLSTSQGAIFLLLAKWSGFALNLNAVLWILGILFLVSFSLTALGFAFAWQLDSIQGFHAVMNLILMPMWMLSGALFPVDSAPMWLRTLMYVNPLTYGLSLLRDGFYPGENVGLPLIYSAGASVGFAVVFLCVAVWVAQKVPGGRR